MYIMKIKEWVLYKIMLWGWKKGGRVTPDGSAIIIDGIDNNVYKRDIHLIRMRRYLLKHPEIEAEIVIFIRISK